MIVLLSIVSVITICVGIVPILQYAFRQKETPEQTSISYLFEKELFDSELDNLRAEQTTNKCIPMTKFKDRGSVRIAQGRVFDNDEFEKRKKEEYAINLP